MCKIRYYSYTRPLSEQLIRGIESNSAGQPYPVYVQRMKAAGIRRYEVSVCSHDRVFYASDDTTLSIPGHMEALACSEQFDLAKTIEAVRRTQRGLTDYLTFLREIAEAGVHTYVADLGNMQVVYKGKSPGEAYIEAIPEI